MNESDQYHSDQVSDTWAKADFRHPHSALGAMAWLMQQAEYHRRWSLHAINVDIVPAIVFGQYRIYHTPEGRPIGFVTWAYVSEAVQYILIHRRRAMEKDDWNSGELLMFNDFVAPFGHGRWMVNELRSTLFADKVAFSLRRSHGGEVRKINRWEGTAYRQETKQREAGTSLCSPHLDDVPSKTCAMPEQLERGI